MTTLRLKHKQGGAPQADISCHYNLPLMRATALGRSTKLEEKKARLEKRLISPENIEGVTERLLARMPYKAWGCRYHSLVRYVSSILKLGWIETTGQVETSAFQSNYPPGQPRKYYCRTVTGKVSTDSAWANHFSALYG